MLASPPASTELAQRPIGGSFIFRKLSPCWPRREWFLVARAERLTET